MNTNDGKTKGTLVTEVSMLRAMENVKGNDNGTPLTEHRNTILKPVKVRKE